MKILLFYKKLKNEKSALQDYITIETLIRSSVICRKLQLQNQELAKQFQIKYQINIIMSVSN